MRIAERQERQNAVAVENLPRRRLMRFFGANGGHQRVVTVIPEGERDIGMLAQPRLGAVGADHQPGGQHAPVLQRDEGVIFAPCYLLERGRGNQRDVRQAFGAFPQRLLDHRIFDDVAEMAEAALVAAEGDFAEAVAIPHFHRIIGAGAQLENVVPHADVLQQTLAGGIDGGDAQGRLFRRRRHLRLALLQHRHAQPAALQAAGQRQPHHTATGDNHVK